MNHLTRKASTLSIDILLHQVTRNSRVGSVTLKHPTTNSPRTKTRIVSQALLSKKTWNPWWESLKSTSRNRMANKEPWSQITHSSSISDKAPRFSSRSCQITYIQSARQVITKRHSRILWLQTRQETPLWQWQASVAVIHSKAGVSTLGCQGYRANSRKRSFKPQNRAQSRSGSNRTV